MRQSLSQLIKFRSPKARNDAILAGILTLLINVIIKSAALSSFGNHCRHLKTENYFSKPEDLSIGVMQGQD